MVGYDLDKGLVDLARRCFGLQELVDNGLLKIRIRDALEFPQEGLRVDLLVVDLFLGRNIPSTFLE